MNNFNIDNEKLMNIIDIFINKFNTEKLNINEIHIILMSVFNNVNFSIYNVEGDDSIMFIKDMMDECLKCMHKIFDDYVKEQKAKS